MVGLGLAFFFHVFSNFDFGNFLDIEVLLFVGLIIDVGFAVNESLERKKD